MSFRITYTERFRKHYKILTALEKKQFQNKLSLFTENPFHPSLRTKRIKGADGLFEFSVNMDIRVIWFYDGPDLVALIDIGHHSILNEY